MSEYSDLSQEQHQEISTKLIICLRDSIENRIDRGEIDGESMCGNYAPMFDNLVWCYYGTGREESGIPHMSSMIKLKDVLSFVDDEILPVIHSHRDDLMNKDWKGRWEMVDTNERGF